MNDTPATESALPPRFTVAATPAQAVALLPALGRVLVGLSASGATFERLGPIEQAGIEDGEIRLGGEAHTARLSTASVARIVGDRTGGMRGRVLPRLEFRNAADELVMSVTCLDGPEQFDAALADWVGATEEAPPRPAMPSGSAELPEDDAGSRLLEALKGSGGKVEIALGTGPARQSWAGVIEDVKPAMGFANIIRPDFHLHWKGGSLGALRPAGEAWEALDPAGAPTGLTFRPLDDATRAVLAASA